MCINFCFALFSWWYSIFRELRTDYVLVNLQAYPSDERVSDAAWPSTSFVIFSFSFNCWSGIFTYLCAFALNYVSSNTFETISHFISKIKPTIYTPQPALNQN
ncbi:hypothetical protein ABFS83_05G000700 [Erythranthe nasuta]